MKRNKPTTAGAGQDNLIREIIGILKDNGYMLLSSSGTDLHAAWSDRDRALFMKVSRKDGTVKTIAADQLDTENLKAVLDEINE